MSEGLAPGHKYCPKVDRLVSTSWTEGECRDYNSCGGSPCPLEADLGEMGFERFVERLRSTFMFPAARGSSES
jgi:hypothetical protein